MRNYEEWIEGLQKDMEMPQQVRAKFEETLKNLPEKRGTSSGRKKIWMKAAAAAAVIIVAGTGVCLANPALAAKIPVIGKIFEQVENDIQFSGQYEGAAVLTEEEAESGNSTGESAVSGEQNADNASAENEKSPAETYTTSDSGVEITASEVYCDGLSVYLTTHITVAEGGLDRIPEYYTSGTSQEDATTAQILYMLGGSWSLQDQDKKADLTGMDLEGKALDEHTFIGMIKFDLGENAVSEGVLEWTLNRIGYDDLDELDSSDITASHKIDGNWQLTIPFTADAKHTKEIKIDKKLDNGYGIEKIFVSPYQVVVYADVPYTDLSPEEFTREDFDNMIYEKTGGTMNSTVTYEEFLEGQRQYEFFEMSVFDKNGKRLDPANTTLGQGKSVYAVQGRDISQLHVFLFDDDSFYDVKQDMDSLKDAALIAVDVDVDNAK